MPRKKHSELVAGLFVIVAVAVTLGVVIWLGPGLLRTTQQVAVFYADEGSGSLGLEVGGFAQINDMPIGRVARIELRPEARRTLYFVEIDQEGVALHEDAKARIISGMIAGVKLVVTSRGSESQPLASEDNPIPLAGGLDQAMTDLSDTARNLKDISDKVKSLLGAGEVEKVLAKINALLDDMRSAGGDLAKAAEQIRVEMQPGEKGTLLAKIHGSADHVRTLTGNLAAQTDVTDKASMVAKAHRSIDDVNAITADAKPKIERTMTAVAETAEQIRTYAKKDIAEILASLREANTEVLKIAKDFSTISTQGREIVVHNRDNIDEMIDNLTQVSVNLKSVSKEVRRNPWRLLYEPKKDEIRSQNIYDAARAFSNGAAELDQAITKLKAVDPKTVGAEAMKSIRTHLTETFTRFSDAEKHLWEEMQK